MASERWDFSPNSVVVVLHPGFIPEDLEAIWPPLKERLKEAGVNSVYWLAASVFPMLHELETGLGEALLRDCCIPFWAGEYAQAGDDFSMLYGHSFRGEARVLMGCELEAPGYGFYQEVVRMGRGDEMPQSISPWVTPSFAEMVKFLPVCFPLVCR